MADAVAEEAKKGKARATKVALQLLTLTSSVDLGKKKNHCHLCAHHGALPDQSISVF